MLLFRSEEQISQWCVLNQRGRGEALTMAQVWELSKAWYHDRLNPEFRGRTVDQAVHIFESVGLDSAFWKPVR
ncbi:MAG: hypothetical protein IT319_02725 [Anaerolineae bacterium]|nr:hypothetical protein [Anaerolineae bacterium]